MKLTYRIALLLAIGVCMGCGCSRTQTDEESEKVAETKKDNPGKRVVLAGVALPRGFSDDVPLYPKATVVTSATRNNTMTATLKTFDSIKKVEAFYQGRLKNAGWKIAGRINKHNNLSSYAKKESRSLEVVISSESGPTLINLALTVPNEK